MKLVKILSALLASIGVFSSADAAVIYSINGLASPSVGQTAAGVTAGPVGTVAAPYVAGGGLGGNFNNQFIDAFQVTGFNTTTQALAVSAADTVSWSFTFNSAGNQLNLTTMNLSYISELPNQNLTLQENSSGAFVDFATLNSGTTTLSGTGLGANFVRTVNSGSSVTFRLVGWNGATGSSVGLDSRLAATSGLNAASSFRLDGTITAVPEPSSLLLAGLIAAPALVWYRRRKSKVAIAI